jgi:AAHS family 4-hydroxybenzoate transporter-like MFS transporter
MAVGSLLIAPLADILGRKKMALFGLVLMALGSLLSGLAHSVGQLLLWRFLTGVGIGACAAVIMTVTAEFANTRFRPMAMALMAIGYPIGGLVGGLLASALLAHFDWRSVFMSGFVGSVGMIPMVALLLPESLAFLLGRDQRRRLVHINSILSRSGLARIDAPPPVVRGQRGYAGVFDRVQRAVTIRLATVSAINTAAAYFTLSWLPQIVHFAGISPSGASLIAAVANLAGIVGGLCFGLFARGRRQTRIAALLLIAEGVAIAVFGVAPASMTMLIPAGALCGFFLYAAATGFYAILPQNFPDSSRSAGIGFVIGCGRVSSAVAPTLAGWLLAVNLNVAQVFALFGAGAIIAGLMLIAHHAPESLVPRPQD